MNYRTYILMRQAPFGDKISASHGKPKPMRLVRKTIAGRGVDTIIIGQSRNNPRSQEDTDYPGPIIGLG